MFRDLVRSLHKCQIMVHCRTNDNIIYIIVVKHCLSGVGCETRYVCFRSVLRSGTFGSRNLIKKFVIWVLRRLAQSQFDLGKYPNLRFCGQGQLRFFIFLVQEFYF